MTILDRIADHARERVARDKEEISFEKMRAWALECGKAGAAAGKTGAAGGNTGNHFYDKISAPGTRFICEVKKASPSKGVIDPGFDYTGIARAYEAAGADALSCLTEPKWFLGSDNIFREIRSAVKLPMLRKDFVVDAYQLYQAKLMGADCVLLICALLDTAVVAEFLGICEELGLAALVETHDETEIASAVTAGARMIGVNARNLKDFSVDLDRAMRFRDLIPPDRLYVAESGVQTPADAARLKAAGADAVLIGEAMMRAPDKAAFLHDMKEAAR